MLASESCRKYGFEGCDEMVGVSLHPLFPSPKRSYIRRSFVCMYVCMAPPYVPRHASNAVRNRYLTATCVSHDRSEKIVHGRFFISTLPRLPFEFITLRSLFFKNTRSGAFFSVPKANIGLRSKNNNLHLCNVSANNKVRKTRNVYFITILYS